MKENKKVQNTCQTTGSWGISRPKMPGKEEEPAKQLIPIWPGTFVWLLAGVIYLIYKLFSWLHTNNLYLIGGIRETQEMLDFCAEHNITPKIEVISADQIDEAYERVLASDVKYRFVIDISTM